MGDAGGRDDHASPLRDGGVTSLADEVIDDGVTPSLASRTVRTFRSLARAQPAQRQQQLLVTAGSFEPQSRFHSVP